MSSVVPSFAIAIANVPYVYYLWPEMQNDVTPVVRIHVFFGGDVDLPCTCLDDIEDQPLTLRSEGYDAETVVELVYEVLEQCRQQAVTMVHELGWSFAGRPETKITCTHDYDPRNPQSP